MAVQGMCTLYSEVVYLHLILIFKGETTGMLVDTGDGVTHVIPVFEGEC